MIKQQLDKNATIQANSELLVSLKNNFPQYFDKDGNFQNEKLQADLKQNNISESKEGYHLGFIGKDYARLQTGQESETIVAPDMEHNSKPENETSENVFITGDNLEALRHLQNAYSGKIKMIYIDPPYNTGKEFVYNDKFEFTDEKLKTALGCSDAEIERIKSIQGKSSHSAWLTFMYPRLKIAQKLLTDDGVIFASIDDNEQANLKLLMDNVFGEGNFVGDIIWNSTKSVTNTALISVSHTYNLTYFKNINHFIENRFEFRLNDNGEGFDNPDNDPRGVWKADPFQVGGWRPNQQYTIVNPNTGEEYKPNSGCSWKNDYKKFQELLADNRIVFGKTGESGPQRKRFIWEAQERGKVAKTLWDDIETTTNGTQLVKKMFEGNSVFDNPKPIELIKRMLELGTLKSNDDIILDFFAGSSTTAHAVMQLNAEDQGNRKFIMVQLDEKVASNSEAEKAGYNSIDEISRERIKKAAEKIKQENPLFAEQGDFGFKHYRLLEPTVQTIEKILEFNPADSKLFSDDMISPFAYEPTNTKGIDTILQTWLIQDGFDFSEKTATIRLDNYEAFYVPKGAVLYLIHPEISHEALKALLNKIGKNELIVNTIIVYPYSFTFEQMRELKNNIKTNIEHKIEIVERY